MDSLDSSSGALPLRPLWNALARRLAVAAGAGSALIALLNNVPLSRACLRGGLAWLLVRSVAWCLDRLLLRLVAMEQPAAASSASDSPDPEGAEAT